MPRMQSAQRASNALDDEVAAAREAAQALEFIEAHLFEALTVERISRACGASVFHFSRRFRQRSGDSVMAYVRGRRLEVAATRLLATPSPSLIELALDSGFESQAAFTRAFTRAFGISPDKYRTAGQPRARQRSPRMSLEPVLIASVEHLETFRVAGLTGRFDPSNLIGVSSLWQAFVRNGDFAGRLGEGETCGVFRDRNFAEQSFEHMAGVRIAAGSEPAGLEIWTLPARDYLVFKQMLSEGALHPQVAAATHQIWTQRVPSSGRRLAQAPDFQIYPANFRVGEGGWLAHYIPVESAS